MAPTRPPNGSILWVAGWGSGLAPIPRERNMLYRAAFHQSMIRSPVQNRTPGLAFSVSISRA